MIKARSYDGKTTIFYNLRNGLGIKVPQHIAKNFDDLSKITVLKDTLKKYGFYPTANETTEILRDYEKSQDSSPFHLIIMPHQNCNFRCVYCYEKFDKNKMLPEVESGLINLVTERLSSLKYKTFTVSWFGGEPLLAVDVIERLSERFKEIAQQFNVNYLAAITTNGYYLDDTVIQTLLKNNVRGFQVTVDGTQTCHDSQRILKNGNPTYERIMNNLLHLSRQTEQFQATVRMNVGPDNLKHVEQHIKDIKQHFGHDNRFQLYFHNIGHWGGPNDNAIDICSENTALKLTSLASNQEMKAMPIFEHIKPHATCYAASPHSFVIGSDGLVYKCTIALYDEFNHVGHLDSDGNLELSEEKMTLWTKSGIQDTKCRNCFFAPSCQGDSCPLVRIREETRPCPTSKKQIKEIITVMDQQGHKFVEIYDKATHTS